MTDRPDFTESTATVPVGMTQIEGGITLTRAGEEKSTGYGEVLVRHALGKRAELRLEVPSYSVINGNGRASGFEDGSIGLKYVLASGSGEFGLKKPRVSLIGSTGLPVGSSQFGSNKLQPEAKLLLGVDLSERYSLSSNLNYALLSENSVRYGEFSASLSFGIGLTERLGAYLETFGFFPEGGRPDSRYINGGLTYLLDDNLQLDARLGVGLDNDVDGPDYFYGVGAARRF